MKAILVIDIADDVAEKYDVLTVDYTLNGDNDKAYECLDYVSDAELRPLPEKNTWDVTENGHVTEFAEGWNACLEEITE